MDRRARWAMVLGVSESSRTLVSNTTVPKQTEPLFFKLSKIFEMLKMKVKSLSHVRLFATPWTIAYQAPPSMGFSGQEYWSGLPFPSPEDLPNPGIEPGLPHCRQTL